MAIREGGAETTEEEVALQAVPEPHWDTPEEDEDGQVFDLNQVVSKIKAHKTAEVATMKLGEELTLTVTVQCVGMGIEMKADGGWEQVQQFKVRSIKSE